MSSGREGNTLGMAHKRQTADRKPRASGPKPQAPAILGYCTNVHSGTSLEEIKRNLEEHTLEVKRQVSPDEPMGVGLWLPAEAVVEFASPDHDDELIVDEMLAFREWLESRGLFAYTLNAFPMRDFHEPVVKHAVYTPDWSQAVRLDYTMALAHILHHLLPPGAEGSISTLPIGWADSVNPGWADHLCEAVESLADLYEATGRIIHLDLEPEPGCEIADTQTMLMFLMVLEMSGGLSPDVLRRHLRVCLDVCHAAVMFEKPTMMLEWLRESGWRIGKVQISSGLRAPFRGLKAAEKKAMRGRLEQFAEDRYLHQTTIGSKDGHKIAQFHDDLPEALAANKIGGGEWRIHYHVPIHLDRIEPLETTQSHIVELLAAIRPEDGIRHYEIETYAWNVLPEDLRPKRLADGIAAEMRWAKEQMSRMRT